MGSRSNRWPAPPWSGSSERPEPDDPRDLAEHRQLEARALAVLGRRREAREAMDEALTLDPRRGAWRLRYVDWLVDWDDLAAASRQARVGLGLAPGDPEYTAALDRVAGLIAAGDRREARAEP